MISKREMLAYTLEKTGLGSLFSQTAGRWTGLVVFNYHRVGNNSTTQFDRGLYSASQDEFDQQVRFLKKNFDVVRVNELEQVRHRPGRAVMITFDDGYRDNYELALPVLVQHQVPATFFITSGFIDGGPVAWWDEIAWMIRSSTQSELPSLMEGCPALSLADEASREQAIRTLLQFYKGLSLNQTRVLIEQLAHQSGSGRCPIELARDVWMSWDMVRQLDSAGLDIGGHTVSHPVLARTSLEMQRQEIFCSKRRIEAEIGHPIASFSYPVGLPDTFTQQTQLLLREAGYRWAFSFSGGFSPTTYADDLNLPRGAVSPDISPELFRSTARLPWLFA